jgi:hypothetical protein
MNGLPKILKIVGVLAVVVAVGIIVGLWGSRKAGPTEPVPPPPPAEPTNPSAPSGGAAGGGAPATGSSPAAFNPAPDAPSGDSLPAMQSNWEERIDAILGAEGEESVKARQLLELFPALPADGQVEVAQHLSNLLTDPEYAPLGHYLTNAALAEPVLDVLIADLLNRPNSVKLPLLLDVARTESHPKAGEALEILQLFLEEDFGKDWARWQSRLQQWLQENPD